MDTHPPQLVQTVEAILRYLDQHPDAADTLEGITRWWLPGDPPVDLSTVEAALARLESQGLVHRHANVDRHILFSR
ncbi:MAG: hypothetical protein AB1899_02155 [Pseudomonadota bacterium]